MYIARKYVADDSCRRSYYEEGIFSSYDLAYDFIRKISEEDDDCFLSEIVAYPHDSHTPCDDKEEYTFDRKGNLLDRYDAREIEDALHVFVDQYGNRIRRLEPAPDSFTGKFKIGDMVFIRAYPWNKVSPMCADIIGVVGQVPVFYSDWVADGNEKYEWDNTYVIYCISSGYLYHTHVQEGGLTIYHAELPDNLKFLRLLSRHLQNIELIPDETLDQVFSGDLFIKKVKHYEFE